MEPKERVNALLAYGQLLLSAKQNDHKVTTELTRCIVELEKELIHNK